jgi:hypothetical protein
MSNLGRFSIDDASGYQDRIEQIQKALITRPRKQSASKSTRINTEISNAFRKSKILAEKGENIEQHRVVRDFCISQEEELRADFALKNGIYHITATLDLRLSSVNLSIAALKAVVLDKARDEFEGARCIGVYAIEKGSDDYKPHIELLKDYAQETYNWLDRDERRAYTHKIYDALGVSSNA